ncbi:MAG: hypothetical protein IJ301_01315 [Clostridia bacterium]|nr:hypothetical protein [Clostridia bacterium]
MNYLKEVLNYYGKNFIYIAVFCLIPAIFCGFLLKPFAMFEFIAKYPELTINTFGDLFGAVYGLNWLDILWILMGFVTIVIAISLLLGFIESHFKTGKVSWSNSFSLNSNALSVAKITIILAIICFVVNLLVMLLVFLVHAIFNNGGIAGIPAIVINYILIFGCMVIIARALTMFILTGIEMLINGSPLRVSFSDATRAIARDGWKIFAVEATLFILMFLLIVLLTLAGLSWLGNIIGLMIFLPVECILGMIVFFDYNGIKRYDKRRLFVKF